jgi:hypothetical protein
MESSCIWTGNLVVFTYQQETSPRHRQKGKIMATDAPRLTYKQQNEVYVLRRNKAGVNVHRLRALIKRARHAGVPTIVIADTVDLSVRQVQRIAKGELV